MLREMRWVPVLACVVVLGGCGISVPEEPGFYLAAPDDEFVRLDGDPEWEQETWPERQNLDSSPHFVVVDPSIPLGAATDSQPVKLMRVGWVRSEIRDGQRVGPATGPRWVAAPIPEFDVPLSYRPAEDRPDVLHAVPSQGFLEPGLYSLQLDNGVGTRRARFGVGWSTADRQAYAADRCVDRYLDARTEAYRLCSQQNLAAGGGGLRIFLSETARRTVEGREALVVSGSVVNPSRETMPIPPILGEVRDPSGRTVSEWTYRLPARELRPGRSSPFRVVIDDVPATATDVSLEFLFDEQVGRLR